MRKLNIKNRSPVQNDFWGNGAIYHGYAGLPDFTGRTYNEEQCEMEADRAATLGLKFIRSYYHWYAWEPETGTWNWNNDAMTAFYRWLDRMKKRNITVALNTGWWCPGDINGTHNYPDTPFNAPGDWEKSVQNYADWVSETVHQLIELRGFTNVKVLTLFTEPVALSGKPTVPGMSSYECWYTASKAAHDALVRDDRRHLVKLMGPNEGMPAYWETVDFNMIKWCEEQKDKFIDIYSAHTYMPTKSVDYSLLRQVKGALNICIAGGRVLKKVDILPDGEYEAVISLKYNKNPEENMGKIYYGVFKDTGEMDIYSKTGGTVDAVSQNSVEVIDATQLDATIQTFSLNFSSNGAKSGYLGVFYDIRCKADADICRIDLLDKNGNSIIENAEFEKGINGWHAFFCGSMDPYGCWYDWAKQASRYVPKDKAFCYDEYNLLYDRDYSRPDHGAEICTAAVAFMNAGVQSSLLWTAFDQQWPNNRTSNGDAFVDGEHRYGLMKTLSRSKVPYLSYYAFGLVSRYVGGGGWKVYEGFGEHRLSTTMAASEDGEITIIVANQSETAHSFNIDFEIPLNSVSFNRHLFDPKTCKPDESAGIIGTDRVTEGIKTSLSDNIPAYGVIIYTTLAD